MNKLLRIGIILIAIRGVSQAAFVTIGDAGYGGVNYNYQIGMYEVTIAELEASGAGDGDENYWNDGVRTVGANAPASNVSLLEAMKYCNWLTSGNVGQGAYSVNESGEGSYSINRAAALATYGTIYALPTYNEWHKAAYYTGDSLDPWSLYANGIDITPIWGTTDGWNYYNGSYVNGSPNYTWVVGYGGEEQNGTYDMMGNVSEWIENYADVIRGGEYSADPYDMSSENPGSDSNGSTYEHRTVGFRVVAVPEPSTVFLFGIGGAGAFLLRRNKRKNNELTHE